MREPDPEGEGEGKGEMRRVGSGQVGEDRNEVAGSE